MGVRERLARALCAVDRLDPDADWRMNNGVMLTVAVEHPERWRTYLPKVDRMLVALLEPSPAMLEAGAGVIPCAQGEEGPLNTADALECWREMLIAARTEA